MHTVALVDTGSTATPLRPDLVPPGMLLKFTVVKVSIVTGEVAPMLEKGLLTIQIGGLVSGL